MAKKVIFITKYLSSFMGSSLDIVDFIPFLQEECEVKVFFEIQGNLTDKYLDLVGIQNLHKISRKLLQGIDYSDCTFIVSDDFGVNLASALKTYSFFQPRIVCFLHNLPSNTRKDNFYLTDIFIVNSHFVKMKWVEAGINFHRIKVINRGIRLPKEYRDENKTNIFGYSGFVDKNKGLELIFKSLKFLDQSFYIIGPKESNFYIPKRPNILYVGKGSNLTNFYLSKDFMVASQFLGEDTSRTIVESLSYGVPIFCSNSGIHREIMLQCGLSNYLFRSNSISSFVDTVFNNPIKPPSFYRNIIEREFGIENTIQQLKEEIL